jgi:hypothetical protein
MNALEVSQRSFDGWNSHDANAIAALYAEGGTYSAPRANAYQPVQRLANGRSRYRRDALQLGVRSSAGSANHSL